MILDILVRTHVDTHVVKLKSYIWFTRRQKLYSVEVCEIQRKLFSDLKQNSEVVKFHVEENPQNSSFRSDEILNSIRIRLFYFKFDCLNVLNIASPNAAFQNKLI